MGPSRSLGALAFSGKHSYYPTAAPATIEAAPQRVLDMPASRVQPYRNDEAARVWEGLLLLDANVAASLPKGTTNETFLQREYEAVILANAITTQAEYLMFRRLKW